MFISVTRLRVRSFGYLPGFIWHTYRSARQAERARGFLGGRMLINSKNVYWTLTAWDGEGAMNEFRTSAAHRAAMPKLLEFCDEAAVVHWAQETAELPSWLEAHRRMVAEGRASKVNHPSAEHLGRQFSAPWVGRLEKILKPRLEK
jgi:heme-degrading monooxygenase HmoA